MKNCLLTVVFLLSLPALAKSEFQTVEVNSSKVTCHYRNQQIHFSNQTVAYSPYEQARNIKLLECNKVALLGYEYFTIRYEAIIDRRESPSKILVYEVVLFQKETERLVTVRSEVVDLISLASDVAGVEFNHALRVTWGKSLINQQPMLKMEMQGAGSPQQTYFLKQDLSSTWFVNIF